VSGGRCDLCDLWHCVISDALATGCVHEEQHTPVICFACLCAVRQMSAGQKYRRTEFEDNDDNNSAGEANSPGVVYNPVIAFHAASFSSGRGAGFIVGRGCCARRSGLEKLLLAVVAALSLVVVILMMMLGTRGGRVPTAVRVPAVVTLTSRRRRRRCRHASTRNHEDTATVCEHCRRAGPD